MVRADLAFPSLSSTIDDFRLSTVPTPSPSTSPPFSPLLFPLPPLIFPSSPPTLSSASPFLASPFLHLTLCSALPLRTPRIVRSAEFTYTDGKQVVNEQWKEWIKAHQPADSDRLIAEGESPVPSHWMGSQRLIRGVVAESQVQPA